MKKIIFPLLIFCFLNNLYAQRTSKGNINILYTPNHPLNSFIPSKNIGGAIDGHFKGDISKMLTPENIKVMKTVGLKPISYRLRSELAGEVWHWNPEGKWSDSAKHQGYWVSDSISRKPIEISYGYRLPRRGNTHDQANDDGYSRISDCDTSTFWKSNPYLDKYYTHESNKLHPQWVIVDFGRYRRINAIKIKWGNPYALSYTLDYAKGNDPDYFDPYEPGIWYPFHKNFIENGEGENKIVKIADKPVKVRFIRISMTQSSYTAIPGSKDIRDSLGFSIKEMQAGLMDSEGKFHDWMHHSPDHDQTVIRVSSTDPWHTVNDLDSNIEQAGIDLIFKSGITAGQPALFPAALLYDTPDNVLAMIKYFKAKHYPVRELEMGEEPEGQLINPVDYAALYNQLGEKIRQLEPGMRMGGPGFASLSFTPDDSTTFTESKWTSDFLNYLKIHNSLNLFNFFSFEWYPFDNICGSPAPQLLAAPKMLSTALKNIQNNILPANTPFYITEYGYSAYEGKSEVEIEGALMYADILAKFMQLGGSKSFLYGYEPAWLQQSNNCGYGNNMIFGLGENGKIKYKTAAFYAMQMLTHFWAQPADSNLDIYPSTSNIINRKKQPLVTSYPLLGPDGKWSVMLINKDPRKTWDVDVNILNVISKKKIAWHPLHLIQYSKLQYQWINDGMNSHPGLNLPPVKKEIKGSGNIPLPPYSITIIY
ncbi:MAG TPA: discoidin domain-containing protein [Hanamia sp.]|nr:discoidin domain-containing protein [Hanamia sp.]